METALREANDNFRSRVQVIVQKRRVRQMVGERQIKRERKEQKEEDRQVKEIKRKRKRSQKAK